MPDLRYLKVPDMFLFGESTYGSLLVMIIFAVIMCYLIKEAFCPYQGRKNIAFIFMLIFLFIHVSKVTGLRFEEYIAYCILGYPGPWSFCFMAIFILYFIRQKATFTLYQGFWLSVSPYQLY